jgi:hypothetical protein
MAVLKSLYKRNQLVLNIAFVLIILVFAWLLLGSAPNQNIVPLTANISEIIGEVLARLSPDEEFEKVVDGLVLDEDGQVKTLANSTVRLDLSDGAIVRLASDTLFTLKGQETQGNGFLTRIKMESGKLWVILSGGSLEVETSVGVASVRGSYMSVEYIPETGEVLITCLEGICALSNGGGSVTIYAGQTAKASNFDSPPVVGWMDHEDVQVWLDANPEATLVVVPLTNTPISPTDTASGSSSDGVVGTPTAFPTATATLAPSPEPTSTPMPTPQPTNTQPPPPPPPKDDSPSKPPKKDDSPSDPPSGGGGLGG